MVFWLAVLVGALFAWIGVQIRFFASWIMLFNLVLAAYMGVFLSPILIASIPAATETPYGYALVLLSVSGATLLVAYGICYASAGGRFRAEFPRLLDTVGSGMLGFLSGFLVAGFVALAVSLSPLAQNEYLKTLGLGGPSQETTTAYVCRCCDVLHALVASSEVHRTSEQALRRLRPKDSEPAPPPPPSRNHPAGAVPPPSAAGPAAGEPPTPSPSPAK